MHETRRLAYLRAMGVDVWQPRAADAGSSAAKTAAAPPQPEPEPAHVPIADVPIATAPIARGAMESSAQPEAPDSTSPPPSPPLEADDAPPPWTDADLQGLMPDDDAHRLDLPDEAPPKVPAINPVADMDWGALEQSVAGCRACGLCERRTNTVFGVGDRNAEVMFIGEGPGADEDRKGEPFVGRAGQLLNRMFAAAGLTREEVYIANIVKCRPPGNRDPAVDEAAACRAYLIRQIELVAPRLIVCLGRVPASNLLETTDAVGRLRGRMLRHGPTDTPLMVTYHPSYYLRSPEQKAKGWEDLQRMLGFLGQPDARQA
jgi:uracil-DNA glycosylase family 4